MSGVVARVLAARPTGRQRNLSPRGSPLTIAAAILALTDPGAARQLLNDIEVRAGAPSSDRYWLMAWALAEPKRAEALFDAELAALQGGRRGDLDSAGMLKMVEVLVHPRHRREEFLRSETGAWYPGKR